MKQKILIDTDILIDVNREIPTAINRLKLEANTSTLAISSITQMEPIVGCRNKTELQNQNKLSQLLKSITKFLTKNFLIELENYK